VTDPADPGGASQTLNWTVDNVLPTAPRELSDPLTTLSGGGEHNVYFGEFTMGLEPQDNDEGYVVGEFRLNGDGWFNYFGFPDEPFGTAFKFSHSGTSVKALTYGNLGSGGLSKATFEQMEEFGFVRVTARTPSSTGPSTPPATSVEQRVPGDGPPGRIPRVHDHPIRHPQGEPDHHRRGDVSRGRTRPRQRERSSGRFSGCFTQPD
jgi:hypothetical protein